jgi:hypothetical protein
MYHYLLFCLVVILFFFHGCGGSIPLPEEDLTSSSSTTVIDTRQVIDTNQIVEESAAAFTDTSFTYQMLHLTDSLYLPTGYVDGLKFGFTGEVHALQLTSGSAAFRRTVSNSLHRLLDVPVGGPANEAFYQRYLERRKKAYRKEMEPPAGGDEVDTELVDFNEEVTMQAVLNKSDLFTLNIYRYFYRGGAYGNHGNTLLSFTDHPARVLGKEDIFAAGTDEAISKMLLAYADTTYLDQPQITPVTENLGLTARGIKFIYLPYELDMRGNGPLNVTLPLDTLLRTNLLTPLGRTVLERLQ